MNENMNEWNWILGLEVSNHCLILKNVLICKHLGRATTRNNNLTFGPGQLLVLACLTAMLLWSHKESIIINLLFSDDDIFRPVIDMFIFPLNILPFCKSQIDYF